MDRKTALITGACGGIGQKIAEALATRELNLFLAGQNESTLHELITKLSPEINQGKYCTNNLATEAGSRDIILQCIQEFGRLDILILNAGFGVYGLVEKVDSMRVTEMVQVNFLSPFYTIQEAIPFLKKSGNSHLIAINSVAGIRYSPHQYAMYSATKFALRALIEGVRNEVSEYGIKTSLVYPGTVQTSFWDSFGADGKRIEPPLKEVLSPGDVALVVGDIIDKPETVAVSEVVVRPRLQKR